MLVSKTRVWFAWGRLIKGRGVTGPRGITPVMTFTNEPCTCCFGTVISRSLRLWEFFFFFFSFFLFLLLFEFVNWPYLELENRKLTPVYNELGGVVFLLYENVEFGSGGGGWTLSLSFFVLIGKETPWNFIPKSLCSVNTAICKPTKNVFHVLFRCRS